MRKIRAHFLLSYSMISSLSVHDHAAVGMQDLSRHVGRVIRCQKDIAWRHLFRLTGAFHRCVAAKRFDFLARKGGGDQRCPDWTRSNSVDPDILFREPLRANG